MSRAKPKKSEACRRGKCRKSVWDLALAKKEKQRLLEEKRSLEQVIATCNEQLHQALQDNAALVSKSISDRAVTELAKQVLEHRQATSAPWVAWLAEGDELVLTTNAGELRVRPARPGRIDRAEVLLQGVPVKGAASWEEAVRRGAHLAAALGDMEPVE
jgi:hypothetical protein